MQISDAGLAVLRKSLESSSKGVRITKSDNNYNILFKNPAYAYGAVKHGYIVVDSEKLVLSDKEKSEIKKTADEAFNQMQMDTLRATAEHNAHMLQQQAEAIRDAGKEEWVSPLKQLETHSVSMDVEKTKEGFVVKGISRAEGFI